MRKPQSFWALGMLAIALSGAWAQDSSTPPPASDTQQGGSQPVPAYGQDTAPSVTENPPLSGLDLPSLEPHAAPLSYLQPGATFSESIGSNTTGLLGGAGVDSITRGLGSITLKRLWSHYDLAMDYIGGVAYFAHTGQSFQVLQQMDIDQKILWKRGQLSVRDSFSYLPEGNFGAAYGSTGSQGIASLGTTVFGGFWGGSSLGNIGLAPRIMNVSLADISESLSPRSTLTVAGGYVFTHYYGTNTTGNSFIGGSQVSMQVGYNRLLTAKTQIALVYGYQAFDFSVQGTAFHTHVIQGVYGHRISGRLDLLVGAGPQFTFTDTQTAACSLTIVDPYYCQVFGGTLIPTNQKNTNLGVSAQARLRYKFPKASVYLDFERFDTGGSGFFAGAQSNIFNFGGQRPLSRVWDAFFNIGYSTNSRLQPLSQFQLVQCGNPQTSQTACPANNADSYNYGFAGAGVHRAFGRELHAYFSYQFNRMAFANSFCGVGTCNRISNASLATFGLDWTPRPIRID